MSCNHRVRVGILASFLLAVILPSVTVCQPAAISPAANCPAANCQEANCLAFVSPAAIKKFLQMFGRFFGKAPKPKKFPKIPGRRPARPKTPGRPIPPQIPVRQRVEKLLIKTQSTSRAANSAIKLMPNQAAHATRILMKVWQANQEKIDAVVEKMKSRDLSDRKLDKLERELEDVLKDQQKIEELTQKYG